MNKINEEWKNKNLLTILKKEKTIFLIAIQTWILLIIISFLFFNEKYNILAWKLSDSLVKIDFFKKILENNPSVKKSDLGNIVIGITFLFFWIYIAIKFKKFFFEFRLKDKDLLE